MREETLLQLLKALVKHENWVKKNSLNKDDLIIPQRPMAKSTFFRSMDILEKKGLIECKSHDEEGRNFKNKWFKLTEKGRKKLEGVVD